MMADKKNNKNRRNLNKDYDDDFKVRKIRKKLVHFAVTKT